MRERIPVGAGVERVGFVAERVYGVELRPETLDVLQREGNTVHQMAGVHEQGCETNSAYTGASCDHFYHQELDGTGVNDEGYCGRKPPR